VLAGLEGDIEGLVDLQVNGYAGVDFNADGVTTAQITYACERLRQHQVSTILTTVITADLELMCRRIGILVQAIKESSTAKEVIQGIHLEGPFISNQPGYVGTHPVSAVLPVSLSKLERLIDAGQGLVKLVTLAPERDPSFSGIKWLADRGIVVSAGHCDPTLDQLQGAIDHGLSMFTHLGNGCPLLLHRHDNIIQRVLSLSSHLWVCFIADGVHVPFPALRNYLKIVGSERAIVVSDAISAAGMGPGRYSLGSLEVIVDESFATWSSDRQHLMGSACPLEVGFDNLVAHVGLPAIEARRMVRENPLGALGMQGS
jgi:N-acetylglucosamine-6-phosphate deacetylase